MSLVNLLPEDYVARRMQKRATLMCLALFVAVMIGVLSAAGIAERRHQRTEQVSREVNQQYNDAAVLIQQMQNLESIKNRMLQKANRTVALLEHVPRSYILAIITNALPEGASIKEFDLLTEPVKSSPSYEAAKSRYQAISGKPTPTKPINTKVSIVVTGFAGTDIEVARFLTAMAKCPLIETVDLIYSQQREVNDVMAREFQVILHIRNDADVINLSTNPPDRQSVIDAKEKRRT